MRGLLAALIVMLNPLAFGQSSEGAGANDKLTRSEYIESYAPFAVKEMLQSGVPASITLAQGILESGDGNSSLAQKANNHFGIKCHGIWEGEKYYMDDDTQQECFRSYPTVFDSYRDHSEFLSSRDRYAGLFQLRRTDYKGWANGLKAAGYATNPRYPELLIKIIEENGLDKYDRMDSPPKGIDKTPKDKKHVENPKEAVISTSTRQMYLRNDIRYIRLEDGETFADLERLVQLRKWQVDKYNDRPIGTPLVAGEIIYLQPKRDRNPQHSYHFVAKGETLRWISQEYGIKLKKLYSYNELNAGEEPAEGQKIWLRKRKRSEY